MRTAPWWNAVTWVLATVRMALAIVILRSLVQRVRSVRRPPLPPALSLRLTVSVQCAVRPR